MRHVSCYETNLASSNLSRESRRPRRWKHDSCSALPSRRLPGKEAGPFRRRRGIEVDVIQFMTRSKFSKTNSAVARSRPCWFRGATYSSCWWLWLVQPLLQEEQCGMDPQSGSRQLTRRLRRLFGDDSRRISR